MSLKTSLKIYFIEKVYFLLAFRLELFFDKNYAVLNPNLVVKRVNSKVAVFRRLGSQFFCTDFDTNLMIDKAGFPFGRKNWFGAHEFRWAWCQCGIRGHSGPLHSVSWFFRVGDPREHCDYR